MTARKSSVGCLGCFWFLGLVFFTVVEVGLLWWLNPLWLDKRAFWRGEIYGPESCYAVVGEEEVEAAGGMLAPPDARVELWEELAVRADYAPEVGATLDTADGARFEFPPGSIRSAGRIEVVPVLGLPAEMVGQVGIVPWGPLHDVRIGGAEHYVFDVGVPVTFRLDPQEIPAELRGGRVAVGTWEDDRWVELPSRVDAARGTVSATLEHASIEGIIIIVGTAVVGTFVTQTATGRSVVANLSSNLEHTFETENFAVHYSTGPLGVPSDDEYPDARGRGSSEHPLFVQDVGAFLEEALRGLPEVGITPAPGRLLRHDAFLPASPEFGASPLGGPLLLDNDFRNRETTEFPPDFTYRMRVTCVHELIHVGQDPYFNTFNSAKARWWIEATAEYLANRYVEKRGQALDGIDYYIDGEPNLLATPWDESGGLTSYAWARFLDWLHTARNVDVMALVKAVNESGASLSAIDTVLRGAGHEGLDVLFMDFSEEFHHANLWTGKFCDPAVVQENLRDLTPFSHLSYAHAKNGSTQLVLYSERLVPRKHLSTTYVGFQALRFPAAARAKLELHLPPVSGGAGHPYALVGEIQGADLPLSGTPTVLMPLDLDVGGKGAFWVSGPLGSSEAWPDGVQQVSFLLGNTSLTKDSSAQPVRRWLLMPPGNVVYRRDSGTGAYEVTWQESDLAGKAKHGEFAGYNVYRRARGDSLFPKEPLNAAPLTTTTFTDTSSGGEDSVYTVNVVDSLGNESMPAEAKDHDPFQGSWSGKLLLVEGDVTTPIQRWFDETMARDEAAMQAELAALTDPEERQRVRESYERSHANDEKFEEVVMPALEKLTTIVRLGVPFTLDISLRDGAYFGKVTHVLLLPVDPDESPEIPLEVRGNRTLAPKDLPPELGVMILPLHRANEINHVWEFTLDTEQGPLTYGLRINLHRAR